MKPNLILLLAAAICIGLSACDPSYLYDYRLTNGTDSTIHVYYRMNRPHKDTSVDIEPGKEKVIYGSYRFNESKTPQYKPCTNDFDSFVVIRNGVVSSRTYLTGSTWRFTVSKGKGIYFYTTFSSDF